MARAARPLGSAPAQMFVGGSSVADPSRRGVRWPLGIGTALAASELAAVLLAGLLAGGPPATTLTAGAAAVAAARAADLQRPRLVLAIAEDLPGLLVAAGAATLVDAALGGLSLRFAVLTVVFLVLAHTLAYAATHLMRRRGRLRHRVLVVGTGATARRLALTLLGRPELGLEPTGFVGPGHTLSLTQARGLPLALLGPVSTLPRAMTDAGVDAVVVALAGPAGDDDVAALDGLLASSAEVYAVPAWLPEVRAHVRHPAEMVGGVPVLRLHRRGSWPPVRLFKRAVEVLVAAAALVALVPPAAVLGLLAWLETGGVIVRQQRAEVSGRAPVARFRTRRARSVARPGTTFSVAISGRLGPVGRLLRRTRLEALPELLLTQARRVRHAGGLAPELLVGTAPAAHADQTKVDTGQLTR
jgi:hypothetical protein